MKFFNKVIEHHNKYYENYIYLKTFLDNSERLSRQYSKEPQKAIEAMTDMFKLDKLKDINDSFVSKHTIIDAIQDINPLLSINKIKEYSDEMNYLNKWIDENVYNDIIRNRSWFKPINYCKNIIDQYHSQDYESLKKLVEAIMMIKLNLGDDIKDELMEYIEEKGE